MEEMKQGPPHTDYTKEQGKKPYWKRVHHDWKFWLAIMLMLLGMAIYLRTNDFSLWPHRVARQPVP